MVWYTDWGKRPWPRAVSRILSRICEPFTFDHAQWSLIIVLPPSFESQRLRIVIHKAQSIWFQSHMNFSPQSKTRISDEQNQGSKSRLTFDSTIYKSASQALEAYIAQFEGGPSVKTYRRRPSDLLSPAPKFYFMDSLERSLRSPPSKSPARKVDELLEWVNMAYAKELSSKVAPFGYRTTPELPGSGEKSLWSWRLFRYQIASAEAGTLWLSKYLFLLCYSGE